MALVASILNDLKACLALVESLKSAEKSQVQAIRDEASVLFEGAYNRFVHLEGYKNSLVVLNQDHVELHVTVAEVAFKTGHEAIARDVLENYFRKTPQKDSYYCRAKLCLALIMDFEASASNGDESISLRRLAVQETMIALTIATEPSNIARYKFIVFNTSVVLWHIVHPFIRAGRAKFFVNELQKMSAALESMDDQDKDWRIMYLAATAFALEDADQKKLGSDHLDKALEHAEKMVASTQEVEKNKQQVMNSAKAKSEALILARRTQEAREELLNKPRRVDPDAPDGFSQEQVQIPELTGLAALSPEDLKMQLDEAQQVLVQEKEKLKVETDKLNVQTSTLTRLYLQRINIFPSDTKRVTGAPQVAESFRAKILTQLQCIMSGAIPEKDWTATFNQFMAQIDIVAKGPPPAAAPAAKKGAAAAAAAVPQAEATKVQLPVTVSNAICETLLDMSRAAWTLGLRDIAIQCSERADQENSLSPSIRVKSDLCKAIRMVADISVNKPNEEVEYRLTEMQREGHSNSKRIEAIKLLERVIGVCSTRLEDPVLLQEICIVIWNTSLPLLEPHLIQNVYRAFQLAASCLADIASPLVQLRAQLHFELAKCEEQNDFVVKAKAQTQLALQADYGKLLNPEPTGSVPGGAAAAVPAAKGVPPVTQAAPSFSIQNGEELDRRRKMDILVKPLDAVLALRSSVYDTPNDIESQVMLMLQQVAESKSRSFQGDMLYRCMSAMCCIIESADNLVASNAILGNGAIPPPASKLRANLHEPPLEQIQQTLEKFGKTSSASAATAAAPIAGGKGKGDPVPVAAAPAVELQVFTELIQTRYNIMFSMAKTASKLGADAAVIVQCAAVYILNFNWNPDDAFMNSLILKQIDVANMLAEALVIRISTCVLTDELEQTYMLALEGFAPGVKDENNPDGEVVQVSLPRNPDGNFTVIEPRCLGVISPYASSEMQTIKSLIISTIQEALKMALRIKDDFSVQNGIVYFWNLHLHVFRRGLENVALPDMLNFLKLAHNTLNVAASSAANVTGVKTTFFTPPVPEIDFRLRVAICEGYATLVASLLKDIPQAQDIAFKGCTEQAGGSAYVRRRLCEYASKLAAPAPATEAPAAGGKAAPAPKSSAEPLKFDHPFLNIFGTLVFAEVPGVAKEAAASLAVKIRLLLDGDLATYIKKLDIPNLSKEDYDQLQELRVCALSRLTRLFVNIKDVYGAYAAAEECTKLIESALSSDPAVDGAKRDKISPRVWRWVSLCERYFGSAVALLIKPEGQELSLQNELRLAALRHYTLSAQFGRNSSEDGLVVDAATDAWNTCMPLIDVKTPETLRPNLHQLLHMIISSLGACTEANYHSGTPAARIGRAADILKQRFFIAIIEGLIGDCKWDDAMKTILQAFEQVPQEYHRAIWRLRVVVMSKRGKSALDGIQKLKEGDPSLQARVYAVLARSASIPAQQLEAYRKAIEVLSTDVNKVEYILEMVQYLGSSGVPKSDSYDLLMTALDSLVMYLQDPDVPVDEDEESHEDDETSSKKSGSVRSKAKSTKSRGTASVRSAAKSATAKSVAASKRGPGSVAGSTLSRARTGTAGSIVSIDPTMNVDIDPHRSNLKHLDYAMRSLAMMSILEAPSGLRLKKSLEAVYFVERSVSLFSSAILLSFRRKMFKAIPPSERTDVNFANYTCEYPESLRVPKCSVDLLLWLPTEEFEEIATLGLQHSETNLDIPSTAAFVSLPLTVHYLICLSEFLSKFGYLSSALLCIAWARVLLMLQTPKYKNISASSIELEKSLDCIHVDLYYRAIRLLKLAGLEQTVAILPKRIGRTERTIQDYIYTFSEGAAAYVAGGNHEYLTSAVANKDVPKSETLNIYGFYSYTPVLPGEGFDKKGCALSVCQSLYDLRSYSSCRSLLNGVLPHCQRGNEYRNVLVGTLLLAKLENVDCRYSNVVALLTPSSEIMQKVGDPTLFAERALLLARAYYELEMLPEALQYGKSALAQIDSSLIIQLPDVRPASSTSKRLEHASNAPAVSNDAISVTSGTSASVTQGIPPSALELSAESLEAYVALCLEIIRILTADSFWMINNQTLFPINQLNEINELSEQCIIRISSVEGQIVNSRLYARLLSAKVHAIYSITMRGHALCSYKLEAQGYRSRIVSAIQGCVTWQHEVCEVYRAMLSQIPAEHEVYFLNSDKIVSPSQLKQYEEENSKAASAGAAISSKDAKGKGAPTATPATSAPPKTKIKEVPSGLINREYGLALVTHSRMLAVLADLRGTNANKRTKRAGGALGNNKYEPTVIDKYLEASAPALESSKQDFIIPELVAGAFSATTAVEALKGTQFESKANLMCLVSLLSQRITDESTFDSSWAEQVLDDDASIGEASVGMKQQVPSMESQEPQVSDLKNALHNALVAKQYEEALYGCTVLVECFGRREPNQAAMLILLSQSIKARECLNNIWIESLPANCEISCVLRRLIGNGDEATLAHTQKTSAVDETFLRQSTVAYDRLGISQSIATIISSLSACHVICLSYSPSDGLLYVAAGVVSSKENGTNPSTHFLDPLNGDWVVEKLMLTEAEQRSLQVLKKQHQTWRQDASKFVASFGDQMNSETDAEEVLLADGSTIEQSIHQQSSHVTVSSSFLKVEHALSERFRALVQDMENILNPVMGKKSRLFEFLHPPPIVENVNSPNKKDAASQHSGHSKGSAPYLHLFVDPILQDLPFEAMEAIASTYHGGVARDYSIHMLGHRLASFPSGSPLSIIASGIRGIVDTFKEDNKGIDGATSKNKSMCDTYKILTTNSALVHGGDKWHGVCVGSGSGISLQQWITAASVRNAGLYVHVPSKLATVLSPSDLALMDMRNVSLAAIIDSGNNDASYRRQNAVDNQKSPRELINGDPQRMAALLSLCGVNCVVSLQWGTSFSSQNNFSTQFWHSLTANKLTGLQSFAKALSHAEVSGQSGAPKGTAVAVSKSTQSVSSSTAPKEFVVKRWLRFAKLYHGVPNVLYDASG